MTQARNRRSAAPDPGLAGERTALAWNRSALALAALGALSLRAASESPLAALGYAIGGMLLLLAAVTGIYGARAYRRTEVGAARRELDASPLPLRIMAIATAVTGLAALVLALLSEA